MTREELKYYKALQLVFKEKMGEWELGDRGWFYGEVIYVTGDTITNPDLFRFDGNIIEEPIRLPLPIDPENPERGLWGMVKDLVGVDRFSEGIWQIVVCGQLDTKEWFYDGETITLALLKALAHQEGITVWNIL